MNLLFNILVTYLTLATAAEAGPVGVAIGAIIGKLTIAKVAAIVLLSVASSVVQTTLMKMKAKKQRQPGIQTERTAQGGVNSRTIMVGLYATAGAEVCPPMSHGRAGFKTPNNFLTYVISLADLPVHALTRLVMNGEYVPIDRTPGAGGAKAAAYGFPIGGKYNDYAWIKFHDGRQAAADAMLLNYYGNYPDRPWTANHIGTGCAYAVITVQYNTERFKGEPTFKFEVQGSRFYDPRKDSTVGGSGAHRWGNAATYEFTLNPDVIKYNILRGITLADGSKWGGECTAEDLPLANWVAAMNVCDEIVDGEARYRCGFEIKVGEDQPADVIEELNKASSSEIVEIGGVYKIRTGGPGLPVMFISDRDILVSEEQTEDPFPSYNEAKNTIYATFPHPGEQWAAHDAPRRQVAEYLAADNGVENAEEMNLAAVPYPKQVQRNVLAWLKDNRRFRQHTGSIGFYAWGIEPLDVIEWSSEKRGYVNKDFDIDETAEDLLTLKNALKMREVDPADYNWQPSFELPDPIAPGGWQLPTATTLEDFAAIPYFLADSDGEARRPAIYVSWDGTNMDDIRSVSIEQTHIATGVITNKSVTDVASGGTFLTDVVAGEAYSVRGKPQADRATTWTSPVQVTAPDVKLGEKDISETVFDEMREIAQRAGVEPVDNLPTTGRKDQIVMKLPEGRLYRWDATLNGGAGGWTENLYAGVAPGSIDRTKFAQGIEPVSVITGSVLPTVKTTETIVFGGKLYRWNGTAYTAAVATVDLTGTIGNAQIADNAVTQAKIMNGSLNAAKFATGLEPVSISTAGTLPTTKTTTTLVWGGKLYRWNGTAYTAAVPTTDLTGTIGNAQIADNAVTQAKIMNGSLNAAKFAQGIEPVSVITGSVLPTVKTTETIVFGGKLYRWNGTAYTAAVATVDLTGQITGTQITDGAVTTDKLGANSVTAGKILAGSIDTDKLAANAVTAAKIMAGAVGADQIAANTITAKHLVISDYSNPLIGSEIEATSNFVPDGNGGSFSATTTYQGKATSLRISGAGSGGFRYRNNLNVAAGEEYYVSLWAYRNTSWNGVNSNSKLRFGDGNGGGHVWSLGYGASELPANGWYKLEGSFTVPSGVTSLSVLLGNDATTSFIYLSDLELRRKNSGELIVDGAITADKLAANSVTAGKIVAGSIDTDKLAAGAVTAVKIDAGAVTTDKLDANAVTAAKIMAGAVGADQIAANAINAKHLVVSDWENLIPNGSLEIDDVSGWSQPGNGRFYTVTSVTQTGTRAYLLQKDAVGNTSVSTVMNSDRAIPVQPGEVLYAETAIRSNTGTATAGAYYRILWYNAAGQTLPSPNNYTDVLNNVPIPSAWVTYSGQVTVPAGAAFCRVQLYNHSTNTTTTNLIFDRLLLRRAAGGNLIVDGAITTDKLAANSVTAGKIVAGSIDTDKLAAGAVTAGKINSGAVTTDKLDANAVTAAKIQAGAVGADQIAANAISAKHLVVSDFTNMILDPDYAPENAGVWGWLGDTAGLGRATAPSPMVRPWSLTITDSISQGTGVRVPPATPIPCKPGEQWYVSMAVRPSGNTPRLATMAFIAYYYTAPNVGAGLPASSSPNIDCASVARIEIGHTFTIPEGVSYVSFGYVRRNSPTQYGIVYVNEMSARRVNGGELIVDGAITANKLAANSVTANAIVAGTITANELATGSVTSVKILANAVTADKILANSVTAEKINVSSLSAITATIGILRTRTTGARLEIRDDVIYVYDASNTLRVRIGNLG